MKKKIFSIIICLTLVCVIFNVAETNNALSAEPETGGVLKAALSTDPPDLNPLIQSGGASERVKTAVYNALLMYNMNGNLEPSLAKSWEINNKTEYVFHLRDAKFHNGMDVTAEDVKFTLEKIMEEGSGAFLQKNLVDNIESIKILDEKTLQINIKEANASFLGLLGMSHSSILCKEWVESGHNLNHEMMGTGAFKFVEWQKDTKITLKKNTNYWREGLPYLDGIEYIPIKDEDVRINSLIAGEVDFVDFPPWKAWDRIENEPNLTVDKTANFAMVLFFNPDEEPFDDPRVRRAVKFAINDQIIANAVFFGHARPSGGGLIPPGHWATTEEIQNYFSYNPEKAKQLLAEAGYPDGFSCKLMATSTYGMHRMTAEVVQDLLKNVGIQVELELEEWGTTVERRAKGDYQFMVYAAGLTRPDPDFYAGYIGSGAGFMAKPVGYKDTITDNLLEIGRRTLDDDLRKIVYHTLEWRFIEQTPIAVLARRETGFAYKDKVKGFLNFNLGYVSCVQPFDQVWLDE